MKPDCDLLRFEKEQLTLGNNLIAGVDEVGRGPLAGPVCCACVIMSLKPEDIVEGVWDSKKLSERKREELYLKIKEKAIAYNVEFVSEKIIDDINILEATKLCMSNAINNINVKPDVVLVDAVMGLKTDIPTISIIKGDALSYTIGCASILAKVERDHLMVELDKTYPGYGLAKHKGYGTSTHIKAIQELGPLPIHRKTFIKHFVDSR